MSGLFGIKKNIKLKNQNLVLYEESVSGDMVGSKRSVRVHIIGEEAFISFANSGAWYEDSTVTEYKVDRKILEDINTTFRKHKMQFWDGKKFTKLFVADGASTSYRFEFDGNESVRFSSQIYPPVYRTKLKEISDIVSEYRKSGELMPGLLVKEKTPEEKRSERNPDNGKTEIGIYEYYGNVLSFRIKNGTEKDVLVERNIRIIRNSDGKCEAEKNWPGSETVYSKKSAEMSVELTERLTEGRYTLYVGEYSEEFEIANTSS